ncbi:MAG: DUF4038 domain-containing protein [Chloroflexi bacterium]|nr:DUF4038 domain-containing protein [Chloroflexota bacterium]
MSLRLLLLFLWSMAQGVISLAADNCIELSDLPPFVDPDTRPYIQLRGESLVEGEKAYKVRGINYYPARAPWRRFLLESTMPDVRSEMQLIRDAGFNSLRIFLWNGALFPCHDAPDRPSPAAFERLDQMMRLAAELDFRLIVTLNDMPDLTEYPLYANPSHVREQTRIIVSRYAGAPAIMAWDLRNEGDIDYGSRSILQRRFPRVQVLAWLRQTAELLRALDKNHLLTAGWLNEAHSTAPTVDFISFHHWSSAEDLQRRIRALQLSTAKPILLEELGYSTFGGLSPGAQAQALSSAISASEKADLLGWMIWTAFDFPRTATCYPSPCESSDNPEHHFGIWDSDYRPKPALDAIGEYLQR